MNYSNGQKVCIGDRVMLWGKSYGIVVFSIDTDEYSEAFPKAEWENLGNGVMVDSEEAELIHFPEEDSDLQLVERKKT